MKLSIDAPVLQSLLTLATVIEARDPYTGGHTWRVSRFAEELARAHGLDADGIFQARVGGLVHDLGKVGVPDAILNKPAPLDAAEFRIMQEHPRTGAAVLETHPLAPLILPAVRQHHERLDGEGYPQRLPAGQVSLMGRILAIADAFDAMTSSRPYRTGLPVATALERLREGAGTQFQPDLVASFAALASSGRLDGIIGHAHEGSFLLACDRCGPLLALPSTCADGDTVQCPNCTGAYRLHRAGPTFRLEFLGVGSRPRVPVPDTDAVASILREGRRSVRIA